MATNDAHIFLADKNGALISVYHKDFSSPAVYEKMPQLISFASWKDSGEFFFRRATYQHPFDFKCSENEKFLAISIAPNRLKLYETTEFEMHSENFVASRMDKLTFSLDNKFIFLGGQHGEIGHFDILQRGRSKPFCRSTTT